MVIVALAKLSQTFFLVFVHTFILPSKSKSSDRLYVMSVLGLLSISKTNSAVSWQHMLLQAKQANVCGHHILKLLLLYL
jgi:hypothetical protein